MGGFGKGRRGKEDAPCLRLRRIDFLTVAFGCLSSLTISSGFVSAQSKQRDSSHLLGGMASEILEEGVHFRLTYRYINQGDTGPEI